MDVIQSITSTGRTEQHETDTTSEMAETTQSGKHPCAFCGTVYDPAEVDCPDCGARLIRRGVRG